MPALVWRGLSFIPAATKCLVDQAISGGKAQNVHVPREASYVN